MHLHTKNTLSANSYCTEWHPQSTVFIAQQCYSKHQTFTHIHVQLLGSEIIDCPVVLDIRILYSTPCLSQGWAWSMILIGACLTKQEVFCKIDTVHTHMHPLTAHTLSKLLNFYMQRSSSSVYKPQRNHESPWSHCWSADLVRWASLVSLCMWVSSLTDQHTHDLTTLSVPATAHAEQ